MRAICAALAPCGRHRGTRCEYAGAMTILCGTDFSDAATQAVTAAAALARRTRQPLEIVNCLAVPAHESHDEASRAAEQHLATEAQRVSATGLDVQHRVLAGDPKTALLERTQQIAASWIVIGPRGQGQAPSKVGSRAESLAANSHVPVLVVRNPRPFVAWAEREQPLRVLLGADESKTTGAALSFVSALRALGPCDVTALHLFWPPEQLERFGYGGSRDFLDVDPEVRKQIRDGLVARWGSALSLPIEVAPRSGNFGEGLARAADHAGAHLVVVGTHGRDVVARIWEGSVSRGLLQQAETNVACAPLAADATAGELRPLRHVLVATDFSESGNAAIALAYSAVAPGGTVFVVHVVEKTPSNLLDATDILALEHGQAPCALRDTIHARLRELAPHSSDGVPRKTTVYVLESNDPARAIVQAAERLHADVICVGTRGRSGFAKAVMGSVAQGVLKHTKRPVLLGQATK